MTAGCVPALPVLTGTCVPRKRQVDPIEVRRLIIRAGLTQLETAELMRMNYRTFQRRMAVGFSYSELVALRSLLEDERRNTVYMPIPSN